MLNTSSLTSYIENQWDTTLLTTLFDYIKIPNKSPHFDADWEAHGYMDKAVALIVSWCQQHAPQGMQLEVVRLLGRTPLIFMEIPGTIDETVLLYGHLDKQPEMEGWAEGLGPWTPVIREGKLYGRGGADDGYAVFASLTAINALQQQGVPHARCVLMIEACEESGSYDLPFYVDALKTRIGHPSLIICLDSGAGNYEQLWMTTSLRGNVVGELSVSLIREGIHSGGGSGIVADSFRVMKQLFSRIEDEMTGAVKLLALQCDIPARRQQEAAVCAEALGNQVYQSYPFHSGVTPVVGDLKELVLNRTWRAQLTVTGAEGFPSIADAGNVLRPKSIFKFSMRLPPLVSAELATEALKNALTSHPPYHAKVQFNVLDGNSGWNAPALSPWLEKACDEASHLFYGKAPVYMGEGGTIPFMGMLGSLFPDAQFMITGVLGPESNAHGPNEFLHLDMVKKLTSCVAYVLHAHYCQFMMD